MRLKFTNYHSGILISIVGLLWAGLSQLLPYLWDNDLFRGFGPTAIVIFLLQAYDRWLWKLPFFKLMSSVPNLNGKYQGKIFYRWDEQDGEKSCELTIKQTCSHIKVKSEFGSTASEATQSTSTEAFIKTDEAGDQHLYFYYHNPGSCRNGDTLNPHDGMNVLEIICEGGSLKLKGYYFTNRDPQTKGCMEVVKITEKDK